MRKIAVVENEREAKLLAEVDRLYTLNEELVEAIEELYASFEPSNDFRPDCRAARKARAVLAKTGQRDL